MTTQGGIVTGVQDGTSKINGLGAIWLKWGFSEGGVKNTTITPRCGTLDEFVTDLHRGAESPNKDGPYITTSDCGGSTRKAGNVTTVEMLVVDWDGASPKALDELRAGIHWHCVVHNSYSDGLAAKGYAKLLETARHPEITQGVQDVREQVISVAEVAGLDRGCARELLDCIIDSLAGEDGTEERLKNVLEGVGLSIDDVGKKLVKHDRLPSLEEQLDSLRYSGPNGHRIRIYIPLTRPIDKREQEVLSTWLTDPLRQLPGGVNIDNCGSTPSQAMYTLRKNPAREAWLEVVEGPILDPDNLPDGKSISEVREGQIRAGKTAHQRRHNTPRKERGLTCSYERPETGFDVQEFIDRHGLDAIGPVEWEDGFRWMLEECPWRPGHDDPGAAFIIQHFSGAVSGGCQHANCPGSRHDGNAWKSLRHMLETRAIEAAIKKLAEKVPYALRDFARAALGWRGVECSDRAALEQQAIDAAKQGGVASPTRTIKKIIQEACPAKPKPRGTTPIFAMVSGAPVSFGYEIPSQYVLTPESTEVEKLKDGLLYRECIAPSPILITARARDAHCEREHVVLAWWRDDSWSMYTVPRATIADARSIVRLADHGFPVTSGTSGALVKYLAELEAVNLAILPCTRVATQMGWVDDVFLLGKERIDACGAGADVVFQGDDAGNDQIASAFHSQGSADDWWAVLADVNAHPKVMVGVFASLAASVVSILKCPSFVLDYAGTTSKGKSTAQEVAASVWGQPIRGNSASVVHSWDATKVGLERTASLTSDLPLILDDTKSARHPGVIGDVVYTYTSGHGRLRGSKAGLASVAGWRGVLISSGEKPVWAFALGQGGIRGRVLTLSGSPFEGEPSEMRRLTKSIRHRLTDTYGHLGPLFVEFVLRHREQWPQWRREFRELAEQLADRAGDNVLAGRMADSFAAMLWIARQFWVIVRPDCWIMDEAPYWFLWDEIAAAVAERDTFSDAMRHVHSWCVGNQARFWKKSSTPPLGGWAGRWDQGVNQPISLLPTVLREVLKHGGFDLDDVWGEWVSRRWVRPDGRHRGRKLRLDGQRVRVIQITPEAIAELEFDGAAEEESEASGTLLPFRSSLMVEGAS